eukprot:COSAG04_NODE_13667_length_596_cov_1.241449_1_plen_165_part_01
MHNKRAEVFSWEGGDRTEAEDPPLPLIQPRRRAVTQRVIEPAHSHTTPINPSKPTRRHRQMVAAHRMASPALRCTSSAPSTREPSVRICCCVGCLSIDLCDPGTKTVAPASRSSSSVVEVEAWAFAQVAVAQRRAGVLRTVPGADIAEGDDERHVADAPLDPGLA